MNDNNVEIFVRANNEASTVFAQAKSDSAGMNAAIGEGAKQAANDVTGATDKMAEGHRKAAQAAKDSQFSITSLATEIQGNFINAIKGGIVAMAGFEGIRKITDFFKECSRATLEESAAMAQLTAAAGANTDAMEAEARMLMQKDTFSKVDLEQAEARMQSYDKDIAKTREMMQAATNLAAARQQEGMTVEQATNLIIRDVDEGSNALSRYGIDMKDLRDGEDRLEGLMRLVNERFGDRAELLAKSDYGKMKQEQNEIEAINAEIGKNMTGLTRYWKDFMLHFSQDMRVLSDSEGAIPAMMQAPLIGANDLLGKSFFTAKQDLEDMASTYMQMPWNKPAEQSGFNMMDQRQTPEQKRIIEDKAKTDKKAAEDSANFQKDNAAFQIEQQKMLGEALAKGSADEWTRQKAVLLNVQEWEVQEAVAHGYDITTLMARQFHEREDLLAEHNRKVAQEYQQNADQVLALMNKFYKEDQAAKEKSDREADEQAAAKRRAEDYVAKGAGGSDKWAQKRAELAKQYADEKADAAKHNQDMAAIDRSYAQQQKVLVMQETQEKIKMYDDFGAKMGEALGKGGKGAAAAEKAALKEVLEQELNFLEKKVEAAVISNTLGDITKLGFLGLAEAAAEGAAIQALFGIAKGKIEGFEGGTGFAPGGPAIVGERGPEIVNLPRGAEVYNNSTTNNIMNQGSQQMAIHLHDNSGQVVDMFYTDMRAGTADRTLSYMRDRMGAL